ncbi:MAG: polysaccharide biosynthesis tyrosine autokinase [Deltaproteobacteria bacterium]|nr:polysaccharide biosynthesis tyrosine autokinase [Deltaproteobacteria bacterium]
MSKLKKALERAKETRQEESSLSEGKNQTIRSAASSPPEIETSQLQKEEVKPTYQRTRVIEIDQTRLRENKIVSLFHQNETADQIRILRTQVLERLTATGGNSILISSPNPQEGKTITAINLAISIAHEVNRTTLLVDADLRKPFVHYYLGFEAEQGLAQYLTGEAEIPDLLVNPGIEKLTILPGGRPLPNSTELLGAPRMQSLVQELKGRYSDRYIIYDTTSLLTQADPIVFSRHVDGIVLVVEAERTTNKDLERTMELLKDRPVIGTLFNKSRDVRP